MVIKNTLSEEDQNTVRTAIETAEQETSGEIVVVLTPQSDSYLYSDLIISIVVAILGQVIITFLYPDAAIYVWALTPLTLILGTLTFLEITGLSVRFVPSSRKKHAVQRMAKEQFLDNCLHTTQEKAGVLIFISLREQRVEILADVGLASHIGTDEWEDIARSIVLTNKQKSLISGISLGISMCAGEMKKYYPSKTGDVNELPDNAIELDDKR